MLAYAATDTRHLAELRDILRNRLIELGRLAWAEEEFVVMEGARWDTEDAEPGWLRLKGAKLLKPRELAVLRSVYQWRDEQARKLDRAAFRILNNEPILAMAKTPPRDMEALKRIPGVGPDQAERRGRQHPGRGRGGARHCPRATCPASSGRPAAPPTPHSMRASSGSSWRGTAWRRDIRCSPACSAPTARWKRSRGPTRRAWKSSAAIPALRRWQVAEIGADLLAALPEPPTPPGQ